MDIASVIPYITNYSVALFIGLNGKYEGPFQARRFFIGLHSITLKLHINWVLGLLSDHCDEPAGWTVIAINPTLGKTFPSSLRSYNTWPPADHLKLEGVS